MDSNPIHHSSPAKTVKCSFLYYIQHLMLARLVNGLEPHPPPLSSQKNEMLIFWSCSTSDDQLGWSMDLNPICQPTPANKMKCFFLDYVQLLMLARLVNGLKPHLSPLSSQRNEMPIFCIMFNCWWSAGLVDGLKPHPPPLSSQRNEMLIFVLHSTSNDRLGWSMDSNPIHHPSSAKTVKCSFLYYIQHLMLARLINGLEPHPPPLPSQKLNAHFCITFNFWWSARLVNGLKPHPPPVSSQKKWNAHILMMFNFWWLAGLVNGLKLPLPPLSSQKHEMLLFGLCSTSDDQLGWLMDSNPILHLSPAKKVKCSFLYYIQHLMLARLVNGLEPHPPLLSSQKNEMLIFGLCSTSDD